MHQLKELHASQELIVPKLQRQINLWLHPEGRDVGSFSLQRKSAYYAAEEEPLEVPDNPSVFLVFILDDPEKFRFYNRVSIIWVKYINEKTQLKQDANEINIPYINMMEPSAIDGAFKESLSLDHSRLLDHLNKDNRSVKIYLNVSVICLVIKLYIIRVSTLLRRD